MNVKSLDMILYNCLNLISSHVKFKFNCEDNKIVKILLMPFFINLLISRKQSENHINKNSFYNIYEIVENGTLRRCHGTRLFVI